jgi:hypothetical protein
MKLIPRSHFNNLRLNDDHLYDTDKSSGKQVVKIYVGEKLIAKSITLATARKTKKRYFGVKGYQQYLSEGFESE